SASAFASSLSTLTRASLRISSVSFSRYISFYYSSAPLRALPSFPTRRSFRSPATRPHPGPRRDGMTPTPPPGPRSATARRRTPRSEEHTSELQSQSNLVCRLLLEKKNHHLDGNILPRSRANYARLPRAPVYRR